MQEITPPIVTATIITIRGASGSGVGGSGIPVKEFLSKRVS
jgi:hypothetical protein